MNRWMAFVFATVGSTIIGLHFDSAWLGVGVYLCIAAAGNWT